MVHLPAFTLQQDMQTTVSIPHATLGQFLQVHPQFHRRVAPGLISAGSPPEAHGSASPAFRHLKYILIVPHNLAAADTDGGTPMLQGRCIPCAAISLIMTCCDPPRTQGCSKGTIDRNTFTAIAYKNPMTIDVVLNWDLLVI